MTQAPRRPVIEPAGDGAFSVTNRPRLPNGQFAKWSTAPPAEAPAADCNTFGQSEAPKRAASPAQLVARVTRAIEREIAQIENIVGGKRTEAEKRARTLASLARTLAEMTRLRAAANEAKPDHDDDAVPRDLDEFRRTLERRLARMVDPPEVVSDRGDETP